MTQWNDKEMKLQLQFIFHFFITFISFISVVLHILYSPVPWVSITKFTIHSNFIVFITFLFSSYRMVKGKNETPFLDFLKNCCLIYMTVNMVTYHFLLASGGEYEGMRVITNFTLHYLIPILTYVNWAVFEKKKKYPFRYIFYWMIYPLCYTAFSMLRGLFDGFYPYFFFNPHAELPAGVGSYWNVAKVAVGFSISFILLGFLLIAINRIVVFLAHKNASYMERQKDVL